MANLNPDTLSSLKVTELKAELKKRELPIAGLKQVLVNRLRDHLLKEQAEAKATEVNGEPEETETVEEPPPTAASEPPLASKDVEDSMPMEVDTAPAGPPTAESPAPAEIEVAEPTPVAEPALTEPAERSSALPSEPVPPIDEDLPKPSELPTENAVQVDVSPSAAEPPAIEERAPTAMETVTEPVQDAEPTRDVEPALPVESDPSKEEARPVQAAPAIDDVEMADGDIPAPLQSDVPPVNIAVEVSDATDPLDMLKRKRRSSSPPPSPSATAAVDEPAAPTPKKHKQDPTSPVPARRDARFKSLFGGAEDLGQPAAVEEDDDPVIPSVHPATRALYIRNFIRPLNGESLRNHIATLASRDNEPAVIETFFIDAIKSHALIVFENTAAATRVRVGMHNKVFPNDKSRKALWADFVPVEKVAGWIETEKEGIRGTGRWEIRYDTSGEEVVTELAVEGSAQQQRQRQQSRIDISNAPSGPRRGGDAPPHLRERRPLVVANLDDLFSSTVTKPKLYYLPVSEHVAAERLAKQGRDAKGRY